MRWLVASIESSCADGSWSSTWLQCTVTASPGFQSRTAEPTRSTTPAASLPTTWYGWSWRAPHTLSLPSRARNANVGDRLEDRRPHGVEVDRRRHHRDERLVGRELGQRHLVDVDRLARVLVRRTERPRTSPARRRAPRRPGTTRAASSAANVGGGRPSTIAVRMASIGVVTAADSSASTPDDPKDRPLPALGEARHARFGHRLVGPHARSASSPASLASLRGHRPRRPRDQGRARRAPASPATRSTT